MNHFRRTKKNVPALSTASLPDIVFMLLFFFMTVTTITSEKLLVENRLPYAEHIKKLDKKDRVIEVYIGMPKGEMATHLGSEPRIQLNNKLVSVSEVSSHLLSELSKKPESVRRYVTVSLKVDQEVNLGLVSDIKQKLREVNLLKVNYTANEGGGFNN